MAEWIRCCLPDTNTPMGGKINSINTKIRYPHASEFLIIQNVQSLCILCRLLLFPELEDGVTSGMIVCVK